jgi:hypothetical protein
MTRLANFMLGALTAFGALYLAAQAIEAAAYATAVYGG